MYGYAGFDALNDSDPFGLYPGQYPPPPPEYDPTTWRTVYDGFRNRWGLIDPSGKKWIAHPEDGRHWRHWDTHDGPGGKHGHWPKKRVKPWPNQKRIKKRSNQCPADPSGDAREWRPTVIDRIAGYLDWLRAWNRTLDQYLQKRLQTRGGGNEQLLVPPVVPIPGPMPAPVPVPAPVPIPAL